MGVGVGQGEERRAPWRLVGHAVVSDDDRIADAEGRFPDALRNDADFRLFQAALARAGVSLIGRVSHVAAPNAERRRLVVSRSAVGIERRTDAWWMHPSVPLDEALAVVLPEGGEVSVPGGQGVFDLVGAERFAAFHLVRVPGVRLPGGRGLFVACEAGTSAEAVLAAGGLVAGPAETIDPVAGVTRVIWARPGEAGS